ncbi:MAG: hypothetical protein ACOCWC_05905 [Bacteroidota bacterium]
MKNNCQHAIEKDTYSKLLLRKTIAVGDLRTLAYEYVKTGGEENNITRDLNTYITSAFKTEETSDISDFEDETDYVLFGKWSIDNTIASSLDHQIEIFHKGSDYYIEIQGWLFKARTFRKGRG